MVVRYVLLFLLLLRLTCDVQLGRLTHYAFDAVLGMYGIPHTMNHPSSDTSLGHMRHTLLTFDV